MLLFCNENYVLAPYMGINRSFLRIIAIQQHHFHFRSNYRNEKFNYRVMGMIVSSESLNRTEIQFDHLYRLRKIRSFCPLKIRLIAFINVHPSIHPRAIRLRCCSNFTLFFDWIRKIHNFVIEICVALFVSVMLLWAVQHHLCRMRMYHNQFEWI